MAEDRLSNDDERFGLGLKPGAHHYRAYVGAPQVYDLIAGLGFTLLFAAGLRETDLVLDVGCGSLRGGRLLIPYLRPGHYYGVEPNEWLVKEGIAQELGEDMVRIKEPKFSTIEDFALGSLETRFDFVLALSIFTHTFDDLAERAFAGVVDCLAERGVLLATFLESDQSRQGTGWGYPDVVYYKWQELQSLANQVGLIVRHLRWPHPRQEWFAGSLSEARVDEVVAKVGEWPSINPARDRHDCAGEKDSPSWAARGFSE